jgi:outer membrane receptor protein involved in Fe transport
MADDAYPRGSNQKQASPIADIHPSDVDRVEIVRGAAAATLYGSEAAAGVIQIFTKRGQSGEPQFTYQTDQSTSWVPSWGSDSRPRMDMDPWLQSAYGQRHSLSVVGGQDWIRYFVSGSFEDRDGVQVGDEERRYSVRSNLSLDVTPTLGLDLNSMFSRDKLDITPSGNTRAGVLFNIYRAPNNFVGGAMLGDPEFEDQISSLLTRSSITNNQRQVVGLVVRWNPLEALNNKLTIGYDRMSQDQETILPFDHPAAPSGEIFNQDWHHSATTIDLTSNLKVTLARNLTGTISGGGQLVRRESSFFWATGEGLPGPGEHNLSSTAQRTVDASEQRVNTGGFFAQGMLGYRDRYFLTGGVRVDGSSAFGEDFGLEVYPKVSASYVISDESFWPASLGTVKLRGAYGFAGRAPGAFDAVRTWTPSSFLDQTAFSPSNVGNPVLGPERTAELEVGFDGAFLQERLTLAFTYYNQMTSDGLLPVTQTPSLGFGGSQLENAGKLKNTGIEVSADATVLERGDLSIDLGVGLTTNKSEMLDMGGTTSYYLLEGEPVPVVRGIKVTNANEYADPIYERDYVFGPSEPTHMLTGRIAVHLPKGLMLTALAEYLGGNYVEDYSSWRIAATRTGLGAIGCDDTAYKLVPHDEYLGPGDTHPNLDQLTALERGRCYRRAPNGIWVMPADFAKLREVTLRAPVPFSIPGIERATVSASLRNLLRWTNSDFIGAADPEVRYRRNQLGPRNINNKWNSFEFADQVPPPASFTFSLRAVFR